MSLNSTPIWKKERERGNIKADALALSVAIMGAPRPLAFFDSHKNSTGTDLTFAQYCFILSATYHRKPRIFCYNL